MGFGPDLADFLFSTWERARGTLVDELKRIRSELSRHGEKYLLGPITVDDLPLAPSTGTIVSVSDSSTNVWGEIVTGSGSYSVLAFFNGTNWTVIGK